MWHINLRERIHSTCDAHSATSSHDLSPASVRSVRSACSTETQLSGAGVGGDQHRSCVRPKSLAQRVHATRKNASAANWGRIRLRGAFCSGRAIGNYFRARQSLRRHRKTTIKPEYVTRQPAVRLMVFITTMGRTETHLLMSRPN